jgi:predicted RNA-binding protein YlxR (DUF448 family)
VGCRGRAPKRELLRLARIGDGAAADPSGTAPGRGVYVHRSEGCVARALAEGGVSRALKVSLSAEGLTTLRHDIERELKP